MEEYCWYKLGRVDKAMQIVDEAQLIKKLRAMIRNLQINSGWLLKVSFRK